MPLLDSEALSQDIVDFDWHGGHSGMVLSENQAQKLDELWTKYLPQIKKDVESQNNSKQSDKAFFK